MKGWRARSRRPPQVSGDQYRPRPRANWVLRKEHRDLVDCRSDPRQRGDRALSGRVCDRCRVASAPGARRSARRAGRWLPVAAMITCSPEWTSQTTSSTSRFIVSYLDPAYVRGEMSSIAGSHTRSSAPSCAWTSGVPSASSIPGRAASSSTASNRVWASRIDSATAKRANHARYRRCFRAQKRRRGSSACGYIAAWSDVPPPPMID